ncbi:MAG TPA: HAD family phosphatase [Thermoanaerobaculia bacterium]|nr:HAD family phosphatase [Thermoanaerobaculia bacterium]
MRHLPERVDAAIFDFDETMIDLEPQHTIASELLCRQFGSDYSRMPESFRHGSGKRVIDDIRDLRDFFGWSSPFDELVRFRQRHFDEACSRADLVLLPGVERAVRTLHARGIPLAVTSSAVGSSIDAILRRTAIRGMFRLIVDGSEVVHPKPHPEAYLVTAGKLGVEPAHCVVFEDSTVGVRAAKRAGMYCIAVRNPNALTPQDLTPADVVLDSFEELRLAPAE